MSAPHTIPGADYDFVSRAAMESELHSVLSSDVCGEATECGSVHENADCRVAERHSDHVGIADSGGVDGTTAQTEAEGIIDADVAIHCLHMLRCRPPPSTASSWLNFPRVCSSIHPNRCSIESHWDGPSGFLD